MIQYNELRIDGDYLYLNVEIEDKLYFNGVTIKGIRIDTPLTYGKDTPYHTINVDNQTKVDLDIYLPAAKNDLLFITLDLNGNPSPDTPCSQSINKIGVVYNKKTLNQKGLAFLKELGGTCITPKGFIDFILKVKALDMSIETCNYNEAIKYWEMLNKTSVTPITNNCGCHGLN